jgi:site-specific recombinase XerD
MIILSLISQFNKHPFYLARPPPIMMMSCCPTILLNIINGGITMKDYILELRNMLVFRGLTANTIKTYTTYIRRYLEYIDIVLGKDPEDVIWEERREFIMYTESSCELSPRTINLLIAVIQTFTIYILHQPWDATQLPKRRFDEYIPYVPSQEETWSFISTITDLKIKAMVALLYSSGLRSCELSQLRYEDISRAKMRVHIAKSKNRSEGYAQLSNQALEYLTEYWKKNGRPCGWLFPGIRDQEKPIGSYVVLKGIRKHEEHLGLPHKTTCHTFRHAIGTHLYQNGADLPTIQKFLRHKSINSTLIYITLADTVLDSVVNPFDLMGVKE